MLKISLAKKNLLHWCFWFCMGNVLLFWVIGLKYLPTVPWVGTSYITLHTNIILILFFLLSYLGQLALFAFFCAFIMVPVILIYPAQRVVLGFSILIQTLVANWLIVDAMVYGAYRFHLNGIIIKLALGGMQEQILGLSGLEILAAAAIIAVIVLLECFYAFWLKRCLSQRIFFQRSIKWIVIFFGFCLYLSYSIVSFSSGRLMQRFFLDSGRTLPLYTEILSHFFFAKKREVDIERMSEKYCIQAEQVHQPLHYPLQPLQCTFAKSPLNLLIIVIDTWRFDMLNKEVTPNLVRFSNESWLFKNHFSGGNSTGPGVFSLFYGMPATYWTSMQVQKTGPVLLQELINQHYQMGVFTSASPQTPALHHTVLQEIKDLQTRQQPGATPDERDRVVTEKFNQFIDRVASTPQPFFSFLFYDSAHTYCLTHNHLGHFRPEKENCNRLIFTNQTNPVPYRNRYKNALFYVDQQIKQVLITLKNHRLLDNTIVVITGDHGEEFNDNHLGYWGHASNFTHYQVQTPLIIHWPKQPARVFTHQTNHFDIAPTLMAGLARCQARPSDYSLGRNLLDTSQRPYLIINSYIDFGIMEPDKITTIFPIGNYHIDQLNGQPSAEADLNVATMRQVFQDLRRFYKQ